MQKKERNSSFEILRIISMMGIIAIHYFGGNFGGMNENVAFPKFSWFFSQGVFSLAVPLVNCFVIISGYFLVKKNTFEIRKPIELFLITTFYGVLGYLLGIAFDVTSFSSKGLFYAFVPFFNSKRWFVETYIILILFAPFINKVIRTLDKKSFRILLGIMITFFSLWYSVGMSAPVHDDGYGIINFVTLYLIGAYLKLHGEESFLLKRSKLFLFAGFAGSVFATFALSYFINPFGYCFITVISSSVFAFAFFCKINTGSIKAVNFIGGTTFDVYFVHSDIYTSRLLIYELLLGKLVVDSVWMVPHLLGVILAMFLLGIVFYKIRTVFFRFTVDKILDRISFVNKKKVI